MNKSKFTEPPTPIPRRNWLDESKRTRPDESASVLATLKIIQTRVLSGKVDLAMQCKKLPSTISLILEVFATVINTRPGELPSETILLLRNAKDGPILQVSYFAIDFSLPTDLKNVRCLCRISCTGRIHAYKIQEVTEMNAKYIGRLQAISQSTLNKLIRNPDLF